MDLTFPPLGCEDETIYERGSQGGPWLGVCGKGPIGSRLAPAEFVDRREGLKWDRRGGRDGWHNDQASSSMIGTQAGMTAGGVRRSNMRQ
jgi:hypothetical protein